MSMRSNLILVSFLMGACGAQEKKDPGTVYDYYVEPGNFDGDATAAAKAGDKTGTPGDGEQDKTLHFLTPAADATTSGVYTVSVEFGDVGAGATWSLFYTNAKGGEDGVEIAIDLPLTQTSVDWDTDGLSAATYYLYAQLEAGTSTTRHDATATVTVADGTVGGDTTPGGNRKPALRLDVPNGDNVFVAGVPQAITFTATDADSDKMTYKLEYSTDGATWKPIAANLAAATYDWDVAGLVQGITYRVRVSADDGKGGVTTVTSSKPFGVATQPMTFAAGFGAMLTQRCGTCHGAAGVNAAMFRSDNYDLAAIGVQDKQMNIKARVEANTMPPAAPLSADDKAIMTLWLWSGAQ